MTAPEEQHARLIHVRLPLSREAEALSDAVVADALDDFEAPASTAPRLLLRPGVSERLVSLRFYERRLSKGAVLSWRPPRARSRWKGSGDGVASYRSRDLAGLARGQLC